MELLFWIFEACSFTFDLVILMLVWKIHEGFKPPQIIPTKWKEDVASGEGCHHVFHRLEMGKPLPICIKCGLPLASLSPWETWEWEV